MDSINGIPLIWDNEGDKNLFGKLFQTQTDTFLINQNPVVNNSSTYQSPFSESQRPSDGSLIKLDKPLSVFSDGFSYIIRIEKVKNGSEVLNVYNNQLVAENEIVFFCEETNPNSSNLFKTFVLVKYGSKYKELIYNLKSGISPSIISRIKNATTGTKIETFDDEVQDNFDRITKLFGINVEIETIRIVMENELQVTSSTNKTVAEMYAWYNDGVSFVVDGVNGWLEELKFSSKDYLPTVKKEQSDNLFDTAVKGIDYLIPNEIEKFVSDTLENALTQIAKYSKENLPQTWDVFLKKIYDTIKGYLKLFKQNIEKISEFVGEAFLLARALLMGFVNGLISTVQTLLSLIGWLLKTNGYKKLTGEYYRELNSNLEFIEDFLDLVSEKATDFFNAVKDLMEDFSLEKIKDTIKVFGNKFKELTRYDYAFFAGSFVFEVVLGVILAFFTGGASLVAEAANVAEKQIAIFKLILQEIVSTATMGVVDILRLFKILITKFAQACKNGWAGFKNFLEKLLANNADDVVKEEGKILDEVFEGASLVKRGKYLGQILEEIDIQKIKTFLDKYNVDLQIGKGEGTVEVINYFYPSGNIVKLQPNQAAMFITDGKKMKIVLRGNATLYEFFHELMHFRDCQKIGKKAFLKKSLVEKEKYVYDKVVEYSKYLNRKELKHAEDYINEKYFDYGITDNLGIPKKEVLPFNLNYIPNKRKEIGIDKILKM